VKIIKNIGGYGYLNERWVKWFYGIEMRTNNEVKILPG